MSGGADPLAALVIFVLTLVAISCAALIGRRTGVASPLVLVALGAAVGFLPGIPTVDVDPEWILIGILPPLLYSAAVSMPVMSFRRELQAIASLSVVLVVISSVLLGLFFAWTLDVSLAWGIAMGAVVSPTDAVAVAIARRAGVPPRVLTLLEGESLLNDATALVLLRSATAAAVATVAFWTVAAEFVYAVVVAILVGLVVGRANVWARSRVPEPTVATALSFVVPFVAALPAEHLGASGLVAAVVAGLVTGHRAPRHLPPRARLSDTVNWRTIELILEGTIFLLMGLQLHGLIDEAQRQNSDIGVVLLVAAGGLLATLLVRAAYVGGLVSTFRRNMKHAEDRQTRIDQIQAYVDGIVPDPESGKYPAMQPPWERARSERDQRKRAQSEWRAPRLGRTWTAEQLERLTVRIRRSRADLDYFVSQPVGPREGTIIVWAGMRGAVSLAAAQTLPESAPGRPELVLVACLLALGSLVVQGGTLPMLAQRLRREPSEEDLQGERDERARLLELLSAVAAEESARVPGRSRKQTELAVCRVQRDALLAARDDGIFAADTLRHALVVVDSNEIGLELRGSPDLG